MREGTAFLIEEKGESHASTIDGGGRGRGGFRPGAAPEQGDLPRLQGRWEASVGRRKEFAVALEVKGREVSATITPKIGPKLRANGELQLDETVSPAVARLGQVLDRWTGPRSPPCTRSTGSKGTG